MIEIVKSKIGHGTGHGMEKSGAKSPTGSPILYFYQNIALAVCIEKLIYCFYYMIQRHTDLSYKPISIISQTYSAYKS